MRPIQLKLSGLQSYREMQEVDFTKLCDTGLFGIFGPTGSGKSTLLDAITLSLYGKVERALNGTQGIMNHAEQSLFVSFTFELLSAEGPQCYRVERRFKRLNELSVSNTISRFIEVTPEGDVVLADKTADVTRYVEDKIGLRMDDFTRAVVLPQGKFAEFLSLKGVERRQMLQRIFHLEKYGDALGKKLSRRVKHTTGLLKELEAEQQGLGNASEEAVAQATEQMHAAKEIAVERRRELLDALRDSDELSKVREFNVEHERLSTELMTLQERDEQMSKIEKQLTLASIAERIEPALTAWQQAKEQASEMKDVAERTSENAMLAEADAAVALAVAEGSQEVLTVEEPTLLVRLDQLEQAKVLQAERDVLQVELKKLNERYTESVERRQSLREDIVKEQQLLDKAILRRQQLEEELKQNEVKSSDRRNIEGAVKRKEAITSMREQLSEAENACVGLRQQMDRDKTTLAELDERMQVLKASRKQLIGQAEHITEQLHHSEQVLLRVGEGLIVREHDLRQVLKEREKWMWTARLAEALVEGEPCTVCGSLQHPGSHSHSKSVEKSETELQEIGVIIPHIRELRYSISRDLDSIRSLIDSFDSPVQDGETSAIAEVAVSAEDLDLSSPEDLQSAVPARGEVKQWGLAKARDIVAAVEQDTSRIRTVLQGLLEEGKGSRTSMSEIKAALAGASASESSSRHLLEQSELKVTEMGKQLTQLMTDYEQAHSDLPIDQVDAIFQDIHHKDTQSEEIKGRLEISIPFINEKNEKLSSYNQETVALDKQLIQWETQLEGKQELLQQKEQVLVGWIGDQTADELLREAEQRLAMIRQDVADGKQKWAEAEAFKHEIAKTDVIAAQNAANAILQEEKLSEAWMQQLLTSPFESEEEVTAAKIEPPVVRELSEQVTKHRDSERELHIQLRELDAKLDGRMVSADEWEQCCSKLAENKQLDEEAIQLKARAERDLEDINVRHVRWQEIEQRRLELDREVGLLGKLQAALRGNAFVEYVAEEQLINVSHAASQRLRSLTKQRYSLQSDSGGGFVICDDVNGGMKRPVSTLSGGETFLTSLALALSLSAQIQLRGQYPLQFFFLDEGFGTLDPELLDTVITSLEHLHQDHFSVGVISHVAELRARLQRKLVVIPTERTGEGSKVVFEYL